MATNIENGINPEGITSISLAAGEWDKVTMATNATSDVTVEPSNFTCAVTVPWSIDIMKYQGVLGLVVTVLAWLGVLVVLALYIHAVVFIVRKFELRRRKARTIWILGLFPVYAICCALGVVIPRAGTLVDLVASSYFASCLFNFVRLLDDYMGGDDRVYYVIGDADFHLAAPPCCCCCKCLPTVRFGRKSYVKLILLVMQVAIVRPLLLFLAAVLWTDRRYQPGTIDPANAYIYILVLNLVSSLLAVWGLMLVQRVFRPVLLKFQINGKLACVQLVMLATIVTNIVLGTLGALQVIPCTSLMSSQIRAQRLYHAIVCLLMVPLLLLARRFYLRQNDGRMVAQPLRRSASNPIVIREVKAGTLESLNSSGGDNRPPPPRHQSMDETSTTLLERDDMPYIDQTPGTYRKA